MGDCNHHHYSLTIDTLSLPSPSLSSPACPVPSFSSSTPLHTHNNTNYSFSSTAEGLVSPRIHASNRMLLPCGSCEASSGCLDATVALAECRICQEEEDIANLESPCACAGSLKYVHRKCVQHWCNEKGDTTCVRYANNPTNTVTQLLLHYQCPLMILLWTSVTTGIATPLSCAILVSWPWQQLNAAASWMLNTRKQIRVVLHVAALLL